METLIDRQEDAYDTCPGCGNVLDFGHLPDCPEELMYKGATTKQEARDAFFRLTGREPAEIIEVGYGYMAGPIKRGELYALQEKKQ